MFNVKIIKGKDILIFFMEIIVLALIIVFLSKWHTSQTSDFRIFDKIENYFSKFYSNNMMSGIGSVLPDIRVSDKRVENDEKTKSFFNEILKKEIISMKEIEGEQKASVIENEPILEQEIDNEENNDVKLDNIQKAQINLNTEVITKNPIAENSNRQYGNVKIKNQTSYELTDEILEPKIAIDNKNFILFHTHSCESYMPTDENNYVQTGNFRTTDLNFSVVRVGTELENQLKQYNYNVMHNTSYHDYPSYNGSYTRSLATVESLLKDNPSDIIIDIHRDAIGSRSDYAPTVRIGDTDEAAQLMFVIGTNEGGLWHPNWNQNLKFAVKIQQKAEEMYPGLFKPIMLTKSRYNQHTGKFASIIEVGATGNTLEQCLNSMKYLAKVFDEVL